MVSTLDHAKLSAIDFCESMEPHEFLRDFPEITYKELALICRCSESLVKQWFSSGKGHREPQEVHKALLAYTHRDWKLKESEPKVSREIYQEVMKRRSESQK